MTLNSDQLERAIIFDTEIDSLIEEGFLLDNSNCIWLCGNDGSVTVNYSLLTTAFSAYVNKYSVKCVKGSDTQVIPIGNNFISDQEIEKASLSNTVPTKDLDLLNVFLLQQYNPKGTDQYNSYSSINYYAFLAVSSENLEGVTLNGSVTVNGFCLQQNKINTYCMGCVRSRLVSESIAFPSNTIENTSTLIVSPYTFSESQRNTVKEALAGLTNNKAVKVSEVNTVSLVYDAVVCFTNKSEKGSIELKWTPFSFQKGISLKEFVEDDYFPGGETPKDALFYTRNTNDNVLFDTDDTRDDEAKRTVFLASGQRYRLLLESVPVKLDIEKDPFYNKGLISSSTTPTIQFVHEKEESSPYWEVEYCKKGEGLAMVGTSGTREFSWMGFTDYDKQKNAILVPVTLAGIVQVNPQDGALATDLEAVVELDLVFVS